MKFSCPKDTKVNESGNGGYIRECIVRFNPLKIKL